MGDDVLVERYRRLALLGDGSMGEVWLADDLWLHRQVAVKVLRVDPSAGDDPAAVDRMLRAARGAAQLHHPHVVEVFDLVVAAGQPCVVMEYVDGESLAARIGRLGRLAPVDAAGLIGQVAGALHAAHRAGIVHGDVKPANILIDAAGNAKLADFGIARGAGGLAPTRTGQLTGTLAYTAPEAARTGELTSAGDVWSLGATLYAALEGQAPYHDADDDAGQDPASLLARLVTPMPPPTRSAELTPILLQMLSGEPAERPTAKQVMSGLAAFDAPPAVTPAALSPVPVAEAPNEADPQDTVPRPGSGAYAATIVMAPLPAPRRVPLSASEDSTARLADLHSRRTRRGPWLLLGALITAIAAVVIVIAAGGCWGCGCPIGRARRPRSVCHAPAGAALLVHSHPPTAVREMGPGGCIAW